MPTDGLFPQFARLPPELRCMVWELACRSGPMRFTKTPTQPWQKYIMQHQRQRLSVLGINTEARVEALKHFDLAPATEFPSLRFGDPQQPRHRSHPSAMLATDWRGDLFQVAGTSDSYYSTYSPYIQCLNKARQLAVGRKLFAVARRREQMVKIFLQDFPELQRLIIVYPSDYNFSRRYSELPLTFTESTSDHACLMTVRACKFANLADIIVELQRNVTVEVARDVTMEPQ
ncbi:hypothetical protein F5Y18DRAFT_439775 [Xylariaceae sp. FL1019]|nr:hypothetical protein F5Y18DRAFT_439775 [Xylariaceae sp. FL1019]